MQYPVLMSSILLPVLTRSMLLSGLCGAMQKPLLTCTVWSYAMSSTDTVYTTTRAVWSYLTSSTDVYYMVLRNVQYQHSPCYYQGCVELCNFQN
eukprot:3928366-Rhodomonas_salina.1